MSKRMMFSIAASLALGLAGNASAYHSGGVAECEGCHTMHNSKENAPMSPVAGLQQFNGNRYLLQGSDQSSTCLNCHGKPDTAPTSYHIMTTGVSAPGSVPVQMTPGGDFAWVGKTWSYVLRGTPVTDHGERHGHNVVAADFAGHGMVQDSTLNAAPGGTYPSANLMCISCHDPHGKYRIVDASGTIATTGAPIYASGSYGGTSFKQFDAAKGAVGVYRLLGGVGYKPVSLASVAEANAFVSTSPTALAPSSYNRYESTADTRVAYGSGMSEWCSNCHTQIHNPTAPIDNNGPSSGLKHPAGNAAKLGANADLYNAYVKSGDLTGSATTSYSSLVPYEEGLGSSNADRTTLNAHVSNNGSVKIGPDGATANVMCLSCHRAHASAFESMARWENDADMILVGGSWPGTDSAVVEAQDVKFSKGKTYAETKAGYYNHPESQFATYQRNLCNKCHAKD